MDLQQTKLALADTITEVERMGERWGHMIEERQLEMFELAQHDALALLELAAVQVGDDLARVSIGGRLPVEAINRLLDNTVQGRPLRELLTARFGEHMNDALSILVDGVAQGINPREVARKMIKELGPLADNALTIARTESLRAYREATRESYIATGIVAKYKRVATRDARTCLACLMDDGAVYDVKAPMPEHPNGRCTQIPVLDGADPSWLKGKDWFLTLSEAEQRKMMGPGRFNAWKEGAFDLDDLIKPRDGGQWGPSLGPAPLKDLV